MAYLQSPGSAPPEPAQSPRLPWQFWASVGAAVAFPILVGAGLLALSQVPVTPDNQLDNILAGCIYFLTLFACAVAWCGFAFAAFMVCRGIRGALALVFSSIGAFVTLLVVMWFLLNLYWIT